MCQNSRFWRISQILFFSSDTNSGQSAKQDQAKFGGEDFAYAESIQKNLKIFNFTTTYAILMKLSPYTS